MSAYAVAVLVALGVLVAAGPALLLVGWALGLLGRLFAAFSRALSRLLARLDRRTAELRERLDA